MRILLPVLGAIVVSAVTSAASAVLPLNPRDEGIEDPEACPIDDGEDGKYDDEVYYREDCNLIPDGTDLGLRARAVTTTTASAPATTTTGCAKIPVIKFPCDEYPEACKGMCFNRYCKGQQGNHPAPLHRGTKGSSEGRRAKGGYMSPSQPKQPCNPKNTVDRPFNFNPAWTSMDEFPMALMTEGGIDANGVYGAGFRCIAQSENSAAGSKVKALLNKINVGQSDTPSASNEFDIEFVNYGNIGVDWCNVDKSGNPTSTCKNDGSLFIAKRKDNDRGWDYFKLKDGIGWTGIHP